MTDDEYMDILDIIKEVETNTAQMVKTGGDVYPTNLSPVLYSKDGHRVADLYGWGFPKYTGSGVIINAKSETAHEKRTFSGALADRRCVIPSSGYYEWDKDKNKFLFRHEENYGLYMAGLYTVYNGEPRFVILTTTPNASVEDVHNRMPVVLRQEDIDPWMNDDQAYLSILLKVPPPLSRTIVSSKSSGQTSLF